MGKENEKKFKIIGEIPFPLKKPELIEQGYIFVEKDKHLRVRIIHDVNGYVTPTLGLKFENGKDIGRDEYEPIIQFTDAKEILERCELRLEKIRNSYVMGLIKYDIDEYPNGLKIVEVEFETQEAKDEWEKPNWIGDEISGVYKYSNITLAKKKLIF